MDQLYLPDLGNGRYQNPVILCDYSDPDVIRVGSTYYLTASSFNYTPGLPILTSRDLVNWTLVNYALKNIPEYQGLAPQHAKGVWAPSIRFHDGMFYIYYGMPDEGIFCVRAKDPLGEWESPVCVMPGKGLIDSCPFWDDDGSAWLVHGFAKSRIGFKSVLGIFPMSWDGLKAIGPDRILYDGQKTQPTIEGPKVYKRGEWYYIFAPAGGVATGWQTVLRSKSIHGPWEEKVVLKQGSSVVNGPHQGGWVTAPDGSDWFVHFQSRGLYGRVTHLQPMRWQEDGWPFMGRWDEQPPAPSSIEAGADAVEAALVANGADCGIPVMEYAKPMSSACAPVSEQATDGFTTGKLALQWQFMGNWTEDFYKVENGTLRLNACAVPDGGTTLWQCPQALTQKVACLAFTAETTLDAGALQTGEQAGIALIGGQYAYLALRRTESGLRLCYIQSENAGSGKTETLCVEETGAEKLHLRVTLRNTGYADAEADFYSSRDGVHWEMIAAGFAPSRHTWVGARLGLFCMPTDGGVHGGYATFGAFVVTPDEV